jgi:glutamate formiminotransferase/glutamate formiminotransferase/formiminotetrahydrofolate cyclodeaminase
MALVECVPNFSEGRDPAVAASLVAVIGAVPGIAVLDQSSDPDHHRSVITFAGAPDAIVEAAVRSVGEAARQIDLRRHQGVHPRLGSADVVPFVPLQGIDLAGCAELAHQAGEQIWDRFRVPVCFYGAAARRPERVRLEHVRGQGFEARLADPQFAPDLGAALHPTAGATIVGARGILVAINVNLATTDLGVAKRIAAAIRESSGGFPAVKALGLPLAARGQVQVSMNLTDLSVTPFHRVFLEIERRAEAEGVEVAETELIGLAPRDLLESAAVEFLRLKRFRANAIIETAIGRSAAGPLP